MIFNKPSFTALKPTFDWAALGWLLLFFIYFSALTHMLLQLNGTTSFVGLRQAVLMSFLWLAPVLIFPHKARPISGFIGVILWFFSLFSLGYYAVYRDEFSQSVIFIMFESNPAESSEYLEQYFRWWMIPALVVYSAVAYFLWKRIRPFDLDRKKGLASGLILAIILLGYPVFKRSVIEGNSIKSAVEYLFLKMEPAVPWQMVIGYIHYREQLANMEALVESNRKIPPLDELKDATHDMPATLVLLIGESTNRHHLSLYGYPRNTTPRLNAMRDQLAVFKNVIGPRPYTIEALQQILTFADQEQPDLFMTRPSLMNMMKQAGYKSFWITNQQTMTKRNTMLTNFARQTDEQHFLNNTRSQNAKQLDDEVIAPFEKALQDTAPRKFIIVHMLGTHMKYEYRYSDEFEIFKDRSGAPEWLKDDQVEVYNSYDNAVLFHDNVLASLIEKFSASGQHGFAVYFADHGEDVFQTPPHNFIGRNEKAPTPPMYTVPFFIWQSDSWRKQFPRDFSVMLNRPYSTSHFIHTWSDLAGLTYKGFEPKKSLVSQEFEEHPLLVGDPYSKNGLQDLRLLMNNNAAK